MAIEQKDFTLTADELEALNRWIQPIAERAWAGDDFMMAISVVFTFTPLGVEVTAREGYASADDEVVIRKW